MSALPPVARGLVEALASLAEGVTEFVYLARDDGPRTPVYVSAGVRAVLARAADELVATPSLFAESIHPDDRARVAAELAAWDRARPIQLGYRAVAKDGRHVFCRETCAATLDGDGGAWLHGLVADVTELELVRQTLGAVAGAVEETATSALFCDALAAPLGLGWTAFVDRDGHGVLCRYDERMRRVALTRLRRADPRQLADDAPPVFTGSVRGAGAPVERGRLVGGGRRTTRLDAREERLVAALSTQLAIALQRSDLVRELERTSRERQRLAGSVLLAHEDERRRIASELHDGAGQTLMAAVIQIDLATQAVTHEPKAAQALGRAREQVQATLEELRGLAHALRPATLDKLGLPEALREMGRALAGDALSLEVDASPAAVQLEPELATAIFRIAQASLTNVARHAKARRAALRLDVDEGAGRVTLEVEDDGKGFGRAPFVEGIGLVAMRERAEAVGGRLEVESRPEGGTRVRAVMPLGRVG